MDEVELVQAAAFGLEQAGRRIDALADQAAAPDLRDALRALARRLAEHAAALGQPPAADPGADER